MTVAPPTPTMDALLREAGELFDWWMHGSLWQFVIVWGVTWGGALLLVFAFFKALASCDRPSVELIIREIKKKGEI